MPQNWWEMYPEIVPSPAARPRPMPMLGDAMSGLAMGLQAGQPYSAFGPDPFSSGRFGPSDFTGGQPGIGQLQSRIPDQAGRFGYPEAPQVSDPNGPPLDRRAAVQQAAAAIRGGADPRAVRARLNQVGRDDANFDPSDPFSDLMPGGRQVRGAMNPSGAADQPLSGGDFVSRLYDLNDGAGAGAGDGGAPASFDRAAAIQHAADAIQRGADPDAVHARLIQLGQGDPEPPNPFSDLMPKGRPGMIGDSGPPPVLAKPMFDDRGGLAPRAAAAGFAQGRLGNPPQRLDPRLAPQKSGGLQKSAQLKGGLGVSGPTTLFTNGYPSLPTNGQTTSGNPPPNIAIHTFPLPNDHPFPNPSHVEGEDIVVTGPRRAVRDAMRQVAQHSSELREVGRLIGSGEGNYESYNSGTLNYRVLHHSTNSPAGTVTGRTINEILSTDSLPPTDPRRMHVVGRYEISHANLARAVSEMGLTGNERLTPELQDRIFAEYLIPHTPGLADFIFRGRGSVDDAQYAASRIWASIAVPQGRLTKLRQMSNGRMTFFDDTGPANRANRNATDALRAYLMNLHR